MTAGSVLTELSAMGVRPICPTPGTLKLVVESGTVPAAAIDLAREHKAALLSHLAVGESAEDEIPAGWLPTPEGGLIRDGFEDFDDISPDDVPICPECSRYCDTETAMGNWRCTRCDDAAPTRKQRTDRLLKRRDAILTGKGSRRR